MRRRDALAFFAGALTHWRSAVKAEMAERVRVIGVLIGLKENDPEITGRIATFERGLRDLGWIEGRNLRLHYRFATDADQLQMAAWELLALQPAIIVASSSFVVSELLRVTQTIPIVFVTAADPIGDGFVSSLARPGGMATGFTGNYSSIGGKWLELLKEIAPNIERVAVMFNPATATGSQAYFFPPLEAAALSIGVGALAMPVRNPTDIESAFTALGEPNGGLIVIPDNFTSVHRAQIVEQAARMRVPAIYPYRYFAVDGGLMSYGADLLVLYRRVATYVDRILKGASPADIPVQEPAKVDLVINLKAATELGLTVPRIMLARANEVIE